MQDNAYYLNVAGGDGVNFALVNGDIDEIAYGLKRARKRMDASELEDFSVRFVRTEGIGGDESEGVKPTVLTADADTILTVLNKKIRAERKATRGSDEDETESEDAELPGAVATEYEPASL